MKKNQNLKKTKPDQAEKLRQLVQQNKQNNTNEGTLMNVIIDRKYIQLCAELAYNDVIISEALNEEILQEAFNTEKLKQFFEAIKAAVKKLYIKIKEFILGKIKEFKSKIEEFKKKKEEKKAETKQESASLFDQLMEMVLTEESSGSINWNYVFDIMMDDIDEGFKSFQFNVKNFTNLLDHSVDKIYDSEDKDEISGVVDTFNKNKNNVFYFSKAPGYEKTIVGPSNMSGLNTTFDLVKEQSKKETNYKSSEPDPITVIKRFELIANDFCSNEVMFSDTIAECEVRIDKKFGEENELNSAKAGALKNIFRVAYEIQEKQITAIANMISVLFQISIHLW